MDYDSNPFLQQDINGTQLIGAQPASQSPSFWSKLGSAGLNYIGNNTRFGQDVNRISNAWQRASNEPQSQLIGSSASNNLPSIGRPPSKADMINKHFSNQNVQLNSPQQVEPPPPVTINLPQPQTSQPQGGSISSGISQYNTIADSFA